MKTWSILSAFVIPVTYARQALAAAWGDGYGPSRWLQSPPFLGWGAGWPGMIMTFGFLGLAIAFLILLIRRLLLSGRVSTADKKETSQALEILKQRYAKGEITGEEFRRIRNDLQ
jgi:putative membrane protein